MRLPVSTDNRTLDEAPRRLVISAARRCKLCRRRRLKSCPSHAPTLLLHIPRLARGTDLTPAFPREGFPTMRKDALLFLTMLVGTVLWIGAAPPLCGAG